MYMGVHNYLSIKCQYRLSRYSLPRRIFFLMETKFTNIQYLDDYDCVMAELEQVKTTAYVDHTSYCSLTRAGLSDGRGEIISNGHFYQLKKWIAKCEDLLRFFESAFTTADY
jgi:hypothetical protein